MMNNDWVGDYMMGKGQGGPVAERDQQPRTLHELA